MNILGGDFVNLFDTPRSSKDVPVLLTEKLPLSLNQKMADWQSTTKLLYSILTVNF
jgi:hypothetical protein